jgi:hypothetical protein
MLRFRTLTRVTGGQLGHARVAIGTSRPVCLALLTLLLPACADLREARRGCPIQAAIDAGPIAVDLNPLPSVEPCDELYLRYVTEGAGSLDVQDCTTLEPAETFDCGADFAIACPGPVVDDAGTRLTIEVVGDVHISSLLEGPVGAALVTFRHPAGHVVCERPYEVDAWPYAP